MQEERKMKRRLSARGIIYAIVILILGTFLGLFFYGIVGLGIGFVLSALLGALMIYGYSGMEALEDDDRLRQPNNDPSQLPRGFYNNRF